MPRPFKRTCWHRMVAVDRRFRRILRAQHDASHESYTHHPHRHRLPGLDRHRSRRLGIGRHYLLPRTPHILAHILHHNANSVDSGFEDGGELKSRSDVRRGSGIPCVKRTGGHGVAKQHLGLDVFNNDGELNYLAGGCRCVFLYYFCNLKYN